MSAAPGILEALVAALAFEPQAERTGNLTVGRGVLDGRGVRMALVENRFASGSLGTAECERLAALFRVALEERSPLVLFLDSAGAKVSEGLRALGAFRMLYRAGLEAALAGVPMAAVLGRNCFGGASMLAHLASHRLFSPHTQLAMSGPAILAAGAGMNPLDEMFRAIAEASISAASRAQANGANVVWDAGFDLASWLTNGLAPRSAGPETFRMRHEALELRLGAPPRAGIPDKVQRRDLEKIYPAGYEARESAGFLEGQGTHADGPERFLGIVGKQPLGAGRAWKLANAAWALAQDPASKGSRLRVFLDCATHTPKLDDEKIVLSEYIADMGFALAAAAAAGLRVELTVLGKAGGGVYVALAAPAPVVSAVHGAQIQVLPGAAVAAILGEVKEEAPQAAEYRAAGVAEEELKLGLVP